MLRFLYSPMIKKRIELIIRKFFLQKNISVHKIDGLLWIRVPPRVVD